MGITSRLSYDEDGCAIDFNNLSREFRDSDPVRPFYIMEEKKVHDVTEALINVNSQKIERNKKEIQNIYDESYKANGFLRKPILSLMMWGPLSEYGMQKTEQKCNLRNCSSSLCSNFIEKHCWMYSYSDKVECQRGNIRQLCGPAMTHDMKVIYPCNKSGCNHGCQCGFCEIVSLCPPESNKKKHGKADMECVVQKRAQCQEHWITHPENFDAIEDISVEKNIFYHNGILVSQHRQCALEVVKFSGIKKKCKPCCKNVESHFKFHMVIHLNCNAL
jgi:hypothetical protein